MEILAETVLNFNGFNMGDKDAYRQKFQSSFDATLRCDEGAEDDILPNTEERKHDSPQRVSSTELRHAKHEDKQDWIYEVFRRGHV